MVNDDEWEGTLWTRRQALRQASCAGFALALGGVSDVLSRDVARATGTSPTSTPTVHLVASPSLTEGPFYVNEGLRRSDLRAGSTRPTIANTVPLRLNLTLYASGWDKTRFAPLPNAQIDVWHVDASGAYSDEPRGLNPEDTRGQHWLRGYQVTDGRGQAGFQTIFPGWYNGRTPHIHFKVRYLLDGIKPATFTSQLFVPDALADRIYALEPYAVRPTDAVRNTDDMVYRDNLPDGTRAGTYLTLDPKPTGRSAADGLTAHFTIALVTHPHPSNGGKRRA